MSPANGTATVTVNGSQPFTTSAPSLDAGTPQGISVYAGVIGYNAPAPAFAVYYDNLVVAFPP